MYEFNILLFLVFYVVSQVFSCFLVFKDLLCDVLCVLYDEVGLMWGLIGVVDLEIGKLNIYIIYNLDGFDLDDV